MNLIKLTKTFRHGLAALFVGALLASCGGGGGGGSPSTSTSVTASSTITATGGSVNINGKPVVELSADATSQTAIVKVETRSSTSGGIADEVVIDLGGASPSATAPSEITVYLYPQTVQAGLISFTLPGSTTSYTLDQIIAVGKIGADLTLRGRLEYDTAKGAIKAIFSVAGYGVKAMEAAGYPATLVVNYYNYVAENLKNTVSLYKYDIPTSTWSEVSATENLNGKIPLVLVHGIQLFSQGCGNNSAYKDTWQPLLDNFLATPDLVKKYVVYSLSYPTNLHFKDNGKSFSQKLSQAFGNRPVVVVAHSMGGLVTRAADAANFYIAKGETGFATGINIAHVITLNTPHHGTPYSNDGGTLSEELFCFGSKEGGGSLAWDGIDTGGSCTNTVLCELNTSNAAHLKKYVPYSTYSFDGTAVATLADPRQYNFSLMMAIADPVLMLKYFSDAALNNYFSDAVAKKSDGVVLVPSQRLMSFIGGTWQDNPSLFASLPDTYTGIAHTGVHQDSKVWAQKADGSSGGIKQDLLNFYAEILALTAPTVTLTASPSSIASGATSTLSWLSTNSTSCTSSGSGGTGTSGTFTTPPLTSTTTYTVTCTDVGGSASQSTTVTVAGAMTPTVTLTASPSSIANGATSTLGWSSTNSTSCTSSGGGGTGTAGSFTTPPLTTTTTYTVTCTGPGGTASQSATVTVAGALAPTVTLTASPSSIANGATSTLNWSSTNSTSCTSSGGGGTGTAGTFTTPSLTTTTTYTVTCTGAGGTASQSATVTVAALAPTSHLNDTGITASQCYQAGSDVLVDCGSAGAIALNNAQDGMVGRDANPATNSNTDGKLGFNFSSVPAAGSDLGGCVQDNVTGLMWEVKTTDGGLRDWTKAYTNYSATYDPSLLYGTSTDASGFVTAVNASNLCGHNDWRLPTADELQSIVDYSVAYPGPTVDATWFPNTQGTAFWSPSPVVGNSSHAWSVSFYDGYVLNGYFRDYSYYVRLVRAGQSQTPPRYTVSADGQEVTDNQTNLIWRRCSEGMVFSGGTCTGTASTFTHEAALQLAATQASSTGIAWRLPNVKELSSIADRSLSNPAIDSTAFPATPASWFWSASPYVGNSGNAWSVYFGNGSVGNFSVGRYFSYYARLVRAGQ